MKIERTALISIGWRPLDRHADLIFKFSEGLDVSAPKQSEEVAFGDTTDTLRLVDKRIELLAVVDSEGCEEAHIKRLDSMR